MGILEEINERLKKIEAYMQNAPAVRLEDTSFIDTNTMIDELNVGASTFNNKVLPELLTRGVVKKIAGRYKARRCDFEQYKMTA
jgi:hypothetical protein